MAANALPNGWVVTVMTNVPYDTLPSPTVASLPIGWDDPDVTIPIGFTHTYAGQSTNTMYIDGSNVSLGMDISTGLTGTFNIYSPFIDAIDRANVPGNPRSYIAYKTDGSIGNRIAKIEWKNVGFYGELDSDSTANDSFNMQMWFYESDNAVEYRIGSWQITDFERDIESTKLPMGIVENYDYNLDEFDFWHYISSLNPVMVDSFDYNNFPLTDFGLSAMPSAGTVIRFSPGAVSVNNQIKLNDELSFYPTAVTSSAHLDFTNPVKGNAVIRVLAMNGQVLSQQKVNQQHNTIDMSQLAASNYMLQVQYNGQSVFYKFAKN